MSTWQIRHATIPLDMPVVVGILNTTPDSFSDGGSFSTVDEAVRSGRDMVDSGAALVDVGGESTRPGAQPVEVDEEMRRVLPVVRGLSESGVLVSVDTSKPIVASRAIEAGACVVNDVTGLRDPEMRSICAAAGVGVVIMHAQGSPESMQDKPRYQDVVSEVTEFLVDSAQRAIEAGIQRDAIVIDPGFGFGKSFAHNLELLAGLETIVATGYPVMVGTSRKGFLGDILRPSRGETVPSERDGATAGTVAFAVSRNVPIFRVHNVGLAADVAHVVKAIVRLVDGKETNRT